MKRVFWIIIAISIYIYVLTSGKEDEVINTFKYLYSYCYKKIKNMDLKVEVNKWPLTEEEKKQQRKEVKRPRRRKY